MPLNRRKEKQCPECGAAFTPFRMGQKTCPAPKCAIAHGRKMVADEAAKERRKDTRARKERIKSLTELLNEAQRACNEWIRWRDRHEPCVSCGRTQAGQWHAGHYRSRKAAPELRFHPLNVHKQCAQCNTHDSGAVVEYRIELRHRIGDDALEWLEGPHALQRLTREDALEIKAYYKERLRKEKKQSGE